MAGEPERRKGAYKYDYQHSNAPDSEACEDGAAVSGRGEDRVVPAKRESVEGEWEGGRFIEREQDHDRDWSEQEHEDEDRVDEQSGDSSSAGHGSESLEALEPRQREVDGKKYG